MGENKTLCLLYWLSDTEECKSSAPAGTARVINLTKCGHNPKIDFDKFKYNEVLNETTDSYQCELWPIPEAMKWSNLILPALVFAALCILLFIMCYKNLKERSEQREQYLANYKELQSRGDEIRKPSRVPHQEFSCGGMKMTFQMCHNMNAQKKETSDPKDEAATNNELKV